MGKMILLTSTGKGWHRKFLEKGTQGYLDVHSITNYVGPSRVNPRENVWSDPFYFWQCENGEFNKRNEQIINNYSTSACWIWEASSAERAIITSYPTIASGMIFLLKRPQNLYESPRLYFVRTNGKDEGLPLFTCHTSIKTVNVRTNWMSEKSKHCSDVG